jgi:hypothetical protein
MSRSATNRRPRASTDLCFSDPLDSGGLLVLRFPNRIWFPVAEGLMTRATAVPGRLKRFSALALGVLFSASSAAADLRPGSLTCETRKPRTDARWWSFRLDVDGVPGRCWYPGKPGKPKTELHWARQPRAERPGTAVLVSPVPDEPGAFTCCWPPLEEPPPPPPVASGDPTFRQRWNDIQNDLAWPVTRWRAPLKDQQRFLQGD